MRKGIYMNRENIKDKLMRYFSIGDSFAYNCTRVNTAWAVGTMSLEDFEQFTEENIDDIVDEIFDDESGWIPCSERLPEDHELYNITHVNDAGIHSDSAIYHPYLKIWFWDEEETIPVTNKITAWQPLPEPYKSE